jgi:H/ACA ribonucleoprotein complex non-core subunit NAF1
MEHPILSMAEGQSQCQQIISPGYPTNNIFLHQMPQNDNEKVITVEFDKCRVNTDKLLDDVAFSDEDEPMIEDYDEQSKKISEIYEEDNTLNRYTGTKNELEERKEIPEMYVIGESDNLHNAGVVEEIVEDRIIVKVHTMMGILDLDNILFNANGICIGYIDDVIGKVDSPYYVVKMFPTLDRTLIMKDEIVFFVEKNAKILRTDRMKRKGCDASNAFDEELPEEEMEYSDDEEEQSMKKVNNFNSRSLK